ncbi:hypothetical protein [Curtobacterium sp. DN_7.5]|uniref:hypothetical protein n=1 Tax=Curtobacterium sp. DN_7.5 TaxID=3049047 RepID=UPI001F56F6C6|nr:hypothetical protein [Curtobacterium sp. DN_7.5]
MARRAGWEALLASLEQDAAGQAVASASPAAAGATAAAGAAAVWTEPTGLGPIPRELVGRASRLVAAQRDRLTALEAERSAVLEHLGALRAVDATREPRGAVYLDASA